MIFFHENARPHVRMTLKNLTDLAALTIFPRSLILRLKLFFKAADHFPIKNTFLFIRKAETVFKDFFTLNILEIYRTVINKLVNRWQKYREVKRLYFD